MTDLTHQASGAGGTGFLPRGIFQHRDVAFAIAIVFLLAILILPVPSWMLDGGLALSIALSAVILMVALWIEKPLELSSFPTILLVVTTLRLALNLASTRLILSEGHQGSDAAGYVIQGFASFVMGGNFVIGIIVFAILVIVNFIVITKGAGRIAEVGARFTLDAMPGKQMAIDADLSAGLIDEQEARRRRQELSEESAFFGAMDGASKFVRGDAVAGLLIVGINVAGGIIIGMMQHGLTANQAAEAYTVLTVGDGLVSQIPALIVSLAAGMLVSKGGVMGSTDKAVSEQLGGYPKALAVAAGLLAVLALAPGLPALPFVLLAGGIGGLAWYLPRYRQAQERQRQKQEAEAANVAPSEEETVGDLLRIDDIKIEVGNGLVILLVDNDQGLSAKVKRLRKRFAKEFGFVMPSVRIRDRVDLPANSYVVAIQGVEVARADVMPRRRLAIQPGGGDVELPGIDTKEPSFGLPAKWIEADLINDAEREGLTVVDAETVITTHLTEVIKEHMPSLITYGATQKMLDEIGEPHRKLVRDLVPDMVPLTIVQRCLQALLAERISVRNLPMILEGIAEASSWTRNDRMIAEHVRSKLALQICQSLTQPDGFIPVITVSPDWEHKFNEHIVEQGDDRTLTLPPSDTQNFLLAARSKLQEHAAADFWPAILVAGKARPFVRALLERVSPATPVLSYDELHRKAAVKTVAQIG